MRRRTLASTTYDLVVVGGGVMGSSVAFHVARADPALRVAVLERDGSYRHASAMLSAGGIRSQFSLPANVALSCYGIDFLRRVGDELRVDGCDPPDVQFKEQGYLFLATAEGESVLRDNHATQHATGATWTTLLGPKQLQAQFPWLVTDGLTLGCFGERNEGWFDPWALLQALKAKSRVLGVDYVSGTATALDRTVTNGGAVDSVVVDGGERRLTAKHVVCAAGAWAGDLVRTCTGPPVMDLPVRPRKRCIFTFHCPEAAAPNATDTPLTVLPETGVYFRPEGRQGHFLCGVSPPADQDPDSTIEDLAYADDHLFTGTIWPSLFERVPAFGNLKQTASWAGFYEYNTVDQNAVIGFHPDVPNLLLVTGFSGHGLQQSPGAGRAAAELLTTGAFQTVDVSCFGFDRFIRNEPIFERNIV